MAAVSKRASKKAGKRSVKPRATEPGLLAALFTAGVLVAIGWYCWETARQYTFSFQSPLVIKWQSPVVVAHRSLSEPAALARFDQNGKSLTAWQQYACQKFGSDCRLALAIQRAENPKGNCEIYHYNNDGTLDWGYFQINTVHLTRPGLNLRDLLDCKANIDFAYQLYVEKRGFTPWSTYKNGAYLNFLKP